MFGSRCRWKDLLVDFEDTNFDYYVHQVKCAPDGRHIALMLRVYEESGTTDYYRVVRIIDIDK